MKVPIRTITLLVPSVFIILLGISTGGDRGQPSLRERAEHLVDQGLTLNDNSDEEAALYLRAIRIDPTYASAHFNLGYVYQSQERLDKAIECYRNCLKYDPKRHEAHRNLAVCLLGVRGDAALYEVRHHLNLSIELQENSSGSRRPLGLEKQCLELLDLERRIHQVLRPRVAEHYTSEEIIRILSRRVTRGGQRVYEGPRLPMLIFETGSTRIPGRRLGQLRALAIAMRSPVMASFSFTVEGHADGRGRAGMNLDLSCKRARAVKDWIVKGGSVETGRLTGEFYGEDHPIFPNDTTEHHRYNRRIEIVRRYAQ